MFGTGSVCFIPIFLAGGKLGILLDFEPRSRLSSLLLYALDSMAGSINLIGNKLVLELLHSAASFVDEATELLGHAGESPGAKDDQGKEPYNYQLLGSY